jgi:hypothetical protein
MTVIFFEYLLINAPHLVEVLLFEDMLTQVFDERLNLVSNNYIIGL